MNQQNRNPKQGATEDRQNVLGNKDEFLNPKHKADKQPSHQVQEMGQPKDKAQMKQEGPASARQRG